MFYFKYTVSPDKVQYSQFQLRGLKHYLHLQCSSIQQSPYHQHVDIKATLQKVIQMIAKTFKFNAKAFFVENFSQPNGKPYVLVNSHRTNFTSHQPNNPWLCSKVNFAPIVKAIFNDAFIIHNLSTQALQKRPYYPHVQILPKVDIEHLIREHDKKHNLNVLQKIKLAYQINHTSNQPYPYSPNYRKALRLLWNPYRTRHYYFTAYYAQFQPNSTHHHQPAVLLQNVQYHHQLITNHCLLFNDNLSQVINSDAKEHNTISFFATVNRYIKHDSTNQQPYLDFSLHHITNVQANTNYGNIVPNNKQSLLALVDKYFDSSQLRYLLINQIMQQKNTHASLYKKINAVKQRLVKLQSLAVSPEFTPQSQSQYKSLLYSAVANLWSGKSKQDIIKQYNVHNWNDVQSMSNQLRYFMHTRHVVNIQSTSGHTQYSARTIQRIAQQLNHASRHTCKHEN